MDPIQGWKRKIAEWARLKRNEHFLLDGIENRPSVERYRGRVTASPRVIT